MSKTKRIIAAVTAAIITATSASLMSVYADNGEVKKADSISATKADNTESSLQGYADDISTYMMANSIAGDAFVHDNKIVVTYSAHEDKIKAYIKEKGIDESIVVYEKGHNVGAIINDKTDAEKTNEENTLDKGDILQEYADDISTYMMANSIAGDALVHDDKVIVTYSAYEDKIKVYVKEKGIDESVIVYEIGKNVGETPDVEKVSALKETAEDINEYMRSNGVSGFTYVHEDDGVEKIFISYDGFFEKIKAYVVDTGVDESLVVYQQSHDDAVVPDKSENENNLKVYADDISNYMTKNSIAGDAFVRDDKVVVTYSAHEDKIKAYIKEKGIDESLVIYEKGQNQTSTERTDSESLKGDANCDGQIDLSDAVMIMQALANPNKYGIGGTAEKHLTEQGQINGDMDGDGLTVGDAQAIQRKLLGLDEKAADLEALRKQLSDFFAEEKIDYSVITKDKMPEQFSDKYVFIKVNTVDTGYAARYGAFLKEKNIDSSLIKSIPYKIDSDTELNKIRALLYCYILENNINASVDPTNEEEDLKNKTVLVKYADSSETRSQLETFLKENNIDPKMIDFYAYE